MTDGLKSSKGNKQDIKNKATYSNYNEWFKSSEARNFVLNNIKKSGLPLELRARKILQDHGFRVSSARYFEPSNAEPGVSGISNEGSWRELDIWAHRAEKTTGKIAGCEIQVYTNIIAECKYSSDKDIFVFEHLDITNADISRFPLPINGHYLLPTNPALCFELPILAERVVEGKADDPTKEKNNYNDSTIHGASEQIISALRYFLTEWRDKIRNMYLNQVKNSTIGEKWDFELRTKPIPLTGHGIGARVDSDFIGNFLRENEPRTLNDFPDIPIHLYFPLLIGDESRGIIKVKLDNTYNPIDLEDIGSCLYLYISENANRYEIVLDNAFVLPILICNLSSLPMIIKLINEGLDKLKGQIAGLVTANLSLVIREVLFNYKIVT